MLIVIILSNMENKSIWDQLPIAAKVKYISVIAIAILFTIFITQNLEKVELNVLFWTFNVRFVFALIFCFLIGVLTTYFWMKMKLSRKSKVDKLLPDTELREDITQ